MHGDKLDDIDLKILEILQKKARTKRGILAEAVGLSIPSISERLHKMEKSGIIRGYYAQLDNRKVGVEITAFIFLYCESSSNYDDIIAKTEERPEILECHSITGKGSHLLKVRVTSMLKLEELLSDIQNWSGIKNTTTDIVLTTSKEVTDLPLEHLKNA